MPLEMFLDTVSTNNMNQTPHFAYSSFLKNDISKLNTTFLRTFAPVSAFPVLSFISCWYWTVATAIGCASESAFEKADKYILNDWFRYKGREREKGQIEREKENKRAVILFGLMLLLFGREMREKRERGEIVTIQGNRCYSCVCSNI
jgi:hypothetical protein